MRRLHVLSVALFCVLLLSPAGPQWAEAQQQVSSTLHNLSVSGPGRVRALSETEVCKFCHIPHNPVVPEPLWGHSLSSAQYRVPMLTTSQGAREPAPQPDGASRLCLSCHDGTVALGDIGGKNIDVAGTLRLSRGQRGFIGTDLSGSHPISIVMKEDRGLNSDPGRDMGLKSPAMVRADRHNMLDASGKVQCTSCHDPHDDSNYQEGKTPHFWVKPTVEAVCLTCHELR